MASLPVPNNVFPHDGNGSAAAVLYGIIPDTNTPALSDTYYPISIDTSGRVRTVAVSPTIIYQGYRRTSAGWNTPVALCNTSVAITSVQVQADYSNTGSVYIGGSTVSMPNSNGRELLPGDLISLGIADLSTVYIDGLTQQRVTYVATGY